jgi:hypothetical protein
MPIILTIATVTGALVAARLLKREWDRVNREIDAAEASPRATTLRRDPRTGVWRPE